MNSLSSFGLFNIVIHAYFCKNNLNEMNLRRCLFTVIVVYMGSEMKINLINNLMSALSRISLFYNYESTLFFNCLPFIKPDENDVIDHLVTKY